VGLALGTEVAVPTLTGKINLKVPAGSQNGQRMRAKGHGLLNKAGERGLPVRAAQGRHAEKPRTMRSRPCGRNWRKSRVQPEKTSDPRPGVARNEQPLIVQLDWRIL
jgi:hypothetical protein